jgi:tetratricopeptide (TPR) repeat protein
VREDAPGACVLLERARALLPAEERPLELELRLVHARFDVGDLAEALLVADELAARSRAVGDRPAELRALLARGFVAHLAEATEVSEVRELVDEALAVFGELGDDAGLAEAWLLASENELSRLRWRAMALALERAIAHGNRGNHPVASYAQGHRFPPYAYGPFSVEEGLAFFDAHPSTHSFYFAFRGQLEAMHGNFEGARREIQVAHDRARELGQRLAEAGHSMQEAEIELNAGDAARAAEVALEGVAALNALGERGWLSTVAGHGAEALYRLGRDGEAWQLTDKAEEAGASDDVITQMLIRQVRAKLLARRGELAEAERLAREAVVWGNPTDALEYKAAAYRDLAIVLVAAGKLEEALAALDEARPLYEQKGHTVGVARVDEMRSELGASLET